MLAEIDSIIESNAEALGEKPDIGVHVLGDGRVRVYALALGWRKKPYREYTSIAAAHHAAQVAQRHAKKVKRLIARGMATRDAVYHTVYDGGFA